MIVMKGLFGIIVLMALFGCTNNDVTWISIKNGTTIPIYTLPYSSDFTNAEWIQPGVTDDFYSITCDCLDGFTYFSFYYDSLIVLLKDHEDDPIKFYKDGTTVNYDPALNPFINADVWHTKDFDRNLKSSGINTLEEKHIFEYYFCIEGAKIKSLSVEDASDSGL
jgi:hypothetical protein